MSATALPQVATLLLSDPPAVVRSVLEETASGALLLHLALLGVLGFVLYGGAMGVGGGLRQGASSAAKLPLLIFLTLLVCVPSVQVFALWLGASLSIYHTVALLCAACALWGLLLASLGPVAFFFALQSGYHFLKLFHVGAVAATALAAAGMLWQALRLAAVRDLVPQSYGIVFFVWVILALLVGCQMAWTLRPFLGEPSLPFVVFRRGRGELNFYTAVLASIWRLMK